MQRTLWLWILACGFIAPAVGEACTCPPNPTPQQAHEYSALVFQGTVTAVDPSPEIPIAKQVSMVVSRMWKGEPVSTIKLLTASQGNMCGYDFKVGRSYLVYAIRDAKTGTISTNLCTRTAPLESAGEDLQALEALSTAPAPAPPK